MASSKNFTSRPQLLSSKFFLALIFTVIVANLYTIGIPQLTGFINTAGNVSTSWCGPDAGLTIILCGVIGIFIYSFLALLGFFFSGYLFKKLKITRPNWVAFIVFILGWITYLPSLIYTHSLVGGLQGMPYMILAGIPIFYLSYILINKFTFKLWI